MSNRSEYGPEEAHYTRMRVLKILGLVLALCLACGLGTLFGGGLVYGVMRLSENLPWAQAPKQITMEPEIIRERIVPMPGPNAVIIEVMPGTPAEDAGLQAGDIVLAVDGDSLGAERGLAELIAEHEPGDRIRLSVTRPGSGQMEVSVRLAEHPDKSGAPYLGVRYAYSPYPGAPGSMIMPFERGEGLGPRQMPFAMPGAEVEVGAIIRSVVDDSPASDAGLQEGDVIAAIDGEPVPGPEALVEQVSRYVPGDRVTLTIYKAGEEGEREVTVPLAEHPDDPDRAFLGVSIGGFFERRQFEGGELPEGFRFDEGPGFYGVPGYGFPFDSDELPFDWDQLPFDPRELPFDWHELEPDVAPGDGSA